MTIYDLIFGVSYGQVQVHCCFHNDSRMSAGIGPNGEYNCFACGAKAQDEIGFIQKYFRVNAKRATKIKERLEEIDNKLKPHLGSVTTEQRNYLNSIGITNSIIDKYFNCLSNGKLISAHRCNGLLTSFTWFNSPHLSNYSACDDKYKYTFVNGGMCVPYDDVMRYNRLLICEGEKDMYTAKSMGIKNAVAKLAGTQTNIMPSVDFDNKEIIICYDCDDPGKEGAIADATLLKEKCNCKVKVLDLGLNNKEDLNDYFTLYNHTLDDFITLIQNTPEFQVPPQTKKSKVERLLEQLTDDEYAELKNIILGGTNDNE